MNVKVGKTTIQLNKDDIKDALQSKIEEELDDNDISYDSDEVESILESELIFKEFTELTVVLTNE